MDRFRTVGILAAVGLMLAACAAQAYKPLIDPFPLRFPLVEAGTLEIEGHVVGQPRAQSDIVYYATREGTSTAVVVPSRSVLWRSNNGQPLPSSPRLAGDVGFVRDAGLLRAVDAEGESVWEFRAEGAIQADPAEAGGRIYFGDSERMFYCLDMATGKVRWRRRLQGAALHPAVIRGNTVAVAASNSVVYLLSRKGGSILSWEAVPSRVVYEPVAAGPLALISSASPSIVALDLRTGKRAGQYEASGSLVAGAVWSPPFVVLFVEDERSGGQRMVFLRSH
jgi:outer membrane protein assembly factor BamB